MAERWNDHLMSISNRFWSEIIAVIGVAVICITSLVLQLLRYALASALFLYSVDFEFVMFSDLSPYL